MITKNNQKRCPYCLSDNFSDAVEQTGHPQRVIKKCNDCQKHSVLIKHKGITYPLIDPSNPLSSPGVVTQEA